MFAVVVVVVISVLSSCGMIRSKKSQPPHHYIIAYLEAKQAIYAMCIGYWPPFFCRTF